MSVHSWCQNIPRDEAVRAAEDGREGPLPTLEEAIAGVTNRRPVEPGGGGNVTGGLRTERVTLEIKHFDDNDGDSVYRWNWSEMMAEQGLGINESVRVVEEAHFDDLAQVAMERDAAIRERDTLRAERITQALTADRFAAAVAEADTLRARVAELESGAKLAPAANADGGSNHAAPAASGAAGAEVVAWGYAHPNGTLAFASVQEPEPGTPAIVPLYAAPQAAKGWLTAEERAAIQWAISEGFDEEVLRNILARSSPPEVELPECPYDGYTMLTAEYVWCKCVAVFTEALAAAGVTVKEVGRE